MTLICADGLELDAVWIPSLAPSGHATIIHLPGKGGNFYHNEFLRELYARLASAGFNILGVNTRGAGALVEAFQDGQVVYVGSATETIEAALLDIDAAVGFCTQFGDKIVLQGHSHGCEKALYWSTKRQSPLPLVLLSPANSAELQRRYCPDESLPEQAISARKRIGATPWDMAPSGAYGIRVDGARYEIPVTNAGLTELLAGEGLTIFDDSALGRYVENAALVLIGERDPLQVPNVEHAFSYYRRRFSRGTVEVVQGADHHFHGRENAVATRVVEWLSDLSTSRTSAQAV